VIGIARRHGDNQLNPFHILFGTESSICAVRHHVERRAQGEGNFAKHSRQGHVNQAAFDVTALEEVLAEDAALEPGEISRAASMFRWCEIRVAAG